MSEPVRAQEMRLSAAATRNPLSESSVLTLAKKCSPTPLYGFGPLRIVDHGSAQFHSSAPFRGYNTVPAPEEQKSSGHSQRGFRCTHKIANGDSNLGRRMIGAIFGQVRRVFLRSPKCLPLADHTMVGRARGKSIPRRGCGSCRWLPDPHSCLYAAPFARYFFTLMSRFFFPSGIFGRYCQGIPLVPVSAR